MAHDAVHPEKSGDRRQQVCAPVDHMLDGVETLCAHVDMDAFFVSAELTRKPHLRGKQVVVGGGRGERLGVVAAASYEVRPYGIRSGTSILEAKQRCPNLIIVPPDHLFYAAMSRRVMQVLEDVSPDIQVLSVDEALVDLSGVLRLWGPPMRIAAMMQEGIRREVGVPCSIGVARFPLIAKLASKLAKRNGICMILPGEETGFLYDHKLSLLPGVGRMTTAYLGYLEVRTVADLVSRDPVFWSRLMMTRPLENPYPKSISSEQTLDTDMEDRAAIKAILRELCRKVAIRMRRYRLKATGISVRVRYHDFQSREEHLTRQELIYDRDVVELAMQLFDGADILDAPVRLTGVRLFNLLPDHGSLPVTLAREDRALASAYRVMDRVRRKYGRYSLQQGC